MLIKNCGKLQAYKVVSWAQIAVIAVKDENLALVLPTLESVFSNTVFKLAALSTSHCGLIGLVYPQRNN